MGDKVLVTGAAGQLGSALCVELSEDFLVIPTTRKECDITDLEATMDFVRRHEPNVIVNCAAYTDVDGCELQPERAFAVNALGARNVAIAAREVGAKLVHISTDYVFDGEKKGPYLEWDVPRPINVYGQSKLLGEEYVKEQIHSFFILRTAWLYGIKGRNFVKTMLRLAEERQEIKVVCDVCGTPTYAGDLARQIKVLLATDCYGTYHCSSQGSCTWYEFALEVFESAGFVREGRTKGGAVLISNAPNRRKVVVRPIPKEEFPQPAQRPVNSVLDNYLLRLQHLDGMPHWAESLRVHLPQITRALKEESS